MKINIAVLAGDGIGPEIMAQALHVTQAVCDRFGHELSYEEAMVGACAIDAVGDPYPPETHALCMQSDAVLFGAIGHPKFDNDPKAKVRPEQGLLRMRKQLGLYGNIRPVMTFPQIAAPCRPRLRSRFRMHPRAYRRHVLRSSAGTERRRQYGL